MTGMTASETDRSRVCLSGEAMAVLHELRTANELCDAIVTLEDGASFPVHMAILSACSPFFRALFTTARLGPDKPAHALIHGVCAREMEIVLNYAYARPMDLDNENVCGVLITSDYLAMLGAKRRCCEFLARALDANNCIAIMKFASAYACPELEQQAWRYLMQHFTAVSLESPDLLELWLDELCAILSADELNTKTEDVVWECVLRWLEHDLDQRRQHLPLLLGCIRLELMDTKYFVTHVKNNELVASDPSCRPIIITVLKYLYGVSSQLDEDMAPPHVWPRLPYELLFAIGGWSAGMPTDCVEVYDSRADHWTQLPDVDPEGPRAYHGMAVISDDIYVVGGFNGVNYFNSCRCYNTVQRMWRQVAPMNARRCYVSVAVVEGELYVMGGYDGSNRQSTVEHYNPSTNQWSFITSMNIQRSDANATTLDGLVYITGGFTGLECLSSAEVYDPETGQWQLIANMTSRRSGVSCCAYRGSIYVVGGFNGISRLSSAETYNPRTNAWTRIANMLQTRSNFALEVVDGALYAVGGFNGITITADVECYDERSNEWYEVRPMNQLRSALAACVVRGLLDVQAFLGGPRGGASQRHRRSGAKKDEPVQSEPHGTAIMVRESSPLRPISSIDVEVEQMDTSLVSNISNHEFIAEEDEGEEVEADQPMTSSTDLYRTSSSNSL